MYDMALGSTRVVEVMEVEEDSMEENRMAEYMPSRHLGGRGDQT